MRQQDDELEKLRTKTSQEVADLTQAINDKTVEKDKSLHRNNTEWKAKNNALMQVVHQTRKIDPNFYNSNRRLRASRVTITDHIRALRAKRRQKNAKQSFSILNIIEWFLLKLAS